MSHSHIKELLLRFRQFRNYALIHRVNWQTSNERMGPMLSALSAQERMLIQLLEASAPSETGQCRPSEPPIPTYPRLSDLMERLFLHSAIVEEDLLRIGWLLEAYLRFASEMLLEQANPTSQGKPPA